MNLNHYILKLKIQHVTEKCDKKKSEAAVL